MRILILNPNTSEAMTRRMLDAAAPYVAPGTTLVSATAPRGFPYISSRAEADVAAGIVLEMIAEHEGKADAVVIAAFGDPGLYAARELFDTPVVGVAEAAMLTACGVGERFGIVTFSPVMSTWYLDAVVRARLEARFAGVRAPAEPIAGQVESVQDYAGERLLGLVDSAVTDDRADVVIVGGAPLAGFVDKVAGRAAVPLIDPVVAALLQAETRVRMGLAVPRCGPCARPPGKPSHGLHPALAKRIAGAGATG